MNKENKKKENRIDAYDGYSIMTCQECGVTKVLTDPKPLQHKKDCSGYWEGQDAEPKYWGV